MLVPDEQMEEHVFLKGVNIAVLIFTHSYVSTRQKNINKFHSVIPLSVTPIIYYMILIWDTRATQ